MKPEIMSSEISRLGSAKSQMFSLTCETKWGIFGRGNKREWKEQAWVPPDWILSPLLPVLLCIEGQPIKKKIMVNVCYSFYSIRTTCYSSDEMAETNLI